VGLVRPSPGRALRPPAVKLRRSRAAARPLPPAGDAAFDAVRALSGCMPGRLGAANAITLTVCLRLVAQAHAGTGGLSFAAIG
jgi:hypothetical protein